jgi:lysyl-tRNA synthetase class I
MKVMLKSLREERQQTYSIFLPIHPETGRVLYVPMKHVDAEGMAPSPSTTRRGANGRCPSPAAM